METCARDSTAAACYTTYLKGKNKTYADDYTRFDACKFELQSMEYRFFSYSLPLPRLLWHDITEGQARDDRGVAPGPYGLQRSQRLISPAHSTSCYCRVVRISAPTEVDYRKE